MKILLLTIQIDIPWVSSLKEKRSIIKSLINKIQNNFNVSIIESDTQDIHKTITISLAKLAINSALLDKFESKVLAFIESNTEGEILKIEREVI